MPDAVAVHPLFYAERRKAKHAEAAVLFSSRLLKRDREAVRRAFMPVASRAATLPPDEILYHSPLVLVVYAVDGEICSSYIPTFKPLRLQAP